MAMALANVALLVELNTIGQEAGAMVLVLSVLVQHPGEMQRLPSTKRSWVYP